MGGGKPVGIQNDPRTEDMATFKVEREKKRSVTNQIPKESYILLILMINDSMIFKFSH